MTVTATPIFPQALKNGFQTITSADTTTVKTLYTAGANGSRVMGVFVSETAGTAQTLTFYITSASTNYLLCILTVAANSGNNPTVLPFSFFSATTGTTFTFPKDSNGNPYLDLGAGSSLTAKVVTTTAGTITLTTLAEDF